MSLVNVTNVVVLDNPTQFTNPFQFEITFECLQDLSEDLEWNVIYVGSSESSDYDQPLEEVLVGPVTAGCHKFVLQADAPNPQLIPHSPLGITVVLITCSYQQHEFVRIGYYVNNEYPISIAVTNNYSNNNNQNQNMGADQEHEDNILQPRVLMPMHDDDNDDDSMNADSTPPSALQPLCTSSTDLTKIIRTTLADKPRVTRFAIPWDEAGIGSEQNPSMEVLSAVTTSMEEENHYRRVVSPTNDMMMTAEMVL